MARKLGDVIDKVLKEKGLKQAVDKCRLQEDWEDIVGGLLSSHLEVVSCEDGRLVLKAGDPGWSQQAQMMKGKLKKAINNHFDYQLIDSVRIVN